MSRVERRYVRAIEWIALNDDTGETGRAYASGLISVALVADLFDLCTTSVADDVLKVRAKLIRDGAAPVYS